MTKKHIFIAVDQEIPFHDVDSLDIVWHGHYVKYFEIARWALMKKLNYGYLDMQRSGYSWPVIELKIRYANPAVFGQIVTIYAELAEWKNWLKINYVIRDKQTGEKLTKGHTLQVAVDLQSKKMCFESPAVLFELIAQSLKD
ncbi:MAG: acyl-CoA thioesterase [Methylococcales bacterium]